MTFKIWSPKKNLYNPGRVLDICAKNEVDPTIGLGGVRPQTHRQTHRQTENSKPEANLIPVDSRGERANMSILDKRIYEFCIHNTIVSVLARSPRLSTGIRVASGFEFSVCLFPVLCSLSVLCFHQIF